MIGNNTIMLPHILKLIHKWPWTETYLIFVNWVYLWILFYWSTSILTQPPQKGRICDIVLLHSMFDFLLSYTPVTLEAEWAGNAVEIKILGIYLDIRSAFEVHSKNSDCITNIRAYSCGRPNIFSCSKLSEVHSKYRNIERHSKCTLTAFWLHSKYSYGIPTAFETFWSHSRENRNGKPLQILPECPECTSNASRLPPESISIFRYLK